MKITHLELNNIVCYKRNSRTHTKGQIKQIEKSIKEFGFINPILIDEKKEIIAGHARLEAAKNLKISKIPSIIISGLTEAQKKAYVIVDNKLALNAGWNDDILSLEIKELDSIDFDINLLGFSEEEIININKDFAPATIEEQGDLQSIDPNYVICPHCGKEFDIKA